MDEARNLVSAARRSGTLLCVAREDLGAPERDDAREKHRQLCAALRDHADIEIHLKDFFGADFANPLCLAEIGAERSLLVVNCHYIFDPESRPQNPSPSTSDSPETRRASARRALRDAFRIDPDSLRFYSFEHIDDNPAPRLAHG